MENWIGVKVEKPRVGRHVIIYGHPEDGNPAVKDWAEGFLSDDGYWYRAEDRVSWTVYSWMVPSGPGF